MLTETANGQYTTRYTYEKGNPTAITNPLGAVQKFAYDAVGNVTRYTDATPLCYEYDSFGNLKSLTYPEGQKVTYAYNKNNRLICATDWNGRTTEYSYDENSLLVETRRPDGTVETRGYDKAGQLTSIVDKKGDTVISSYYYTYDAVGNIVGISSGEAGASSGQPEDAADHFNNVGSTTAVTDENGNVKYQYGYSPYGELIQGNYGEILFLYNGQYGVASDDNGLYYMRARYYNIDIKRFINQDVLTGNIASSPSLNRYAYVEGNPVSYLDPFGLEKEFLDAVDIVLGVIQAGLNMFSLSMYVIGHPEIGELVDVISQGITFTQLALYILALYNATTTDEEELIWKRIDSWTVNFVEGLVLGVIGSGSGFTGNLVEEISQPMMKIITKIVETSFSVLDVIFGGKGNDN